MKHPSRARSNQTALGSDTKRADQAERELALLQRLVDDSPGAWRDFLTSYEALLRAVIQRTLWRKMANGVCKADVDDVLSALLLELLARDMRKLRLYDPARGMRFSSWITLLAVNAAADHARLRRRERALNGALQSSVQRASADDPLAALQSKYDMQELARTLDRLSASDLHFVDHMFFRETAALEIAHSLNISVKTVYTKKHKVLARLNESASRRSARSLPGADLKQAM